MSLLTQSPSSAVSEPFPTSQLSGRLISVIVPCFNESAAIPQLKSRLKDFVDHNSSSFKFEFILVDDGSTDDTYSLLQSTFADDQRFSIIRQLPNRGITAAILAGGRQAQGEWLVSIDSDCTYDPQQIYNLLQRIEDGCADMIIGSPYHCSGKVLNVPRWRLAISKAANRIYRGLFRTKLTCYTSCFRAIRPSIASRVVVQNKGYVGMAEMVWRVERLGGKVTEIPAVLDIRRYGQSKLRLARVVVQHLKFMAKVAFRGN
ncbi:MAG: glycosyltransferase family 2 protein [Pirellulaceae bacterium]